MGYQPNLKTIDCPYCEASFRQRHPAQVICGDRECRLASKRKHHGVTFTCDSCSAKSPKCRSNQRYCSKPECRLQSKRGPLATKVELVCPYCSQPVKANSRRQVTCLSDPCKAAHAAVIRNKGREKRRVGEVLKCRFCRCNVERLQDNQLTCNKPACRAARSQERANERRLLRLKRKPKICPVCFDPILEKRFRTHPKCGKRRRACQICDSIRPALKKGHRTHEECRRRERNDKRRLARNLGKLREEKAAQYRNIDPRSYSHSGSPRMEELKCVTSPRRMF